MRDDRCPRLPADTAGRATPQDGPKADRRGLCAQGEGQPASPIWRCDDATGAAYALKLKAAGAKALKEEEAASAASGQTGSSTVRQPDAVAGPTTAPRAVRRSWRVVHLGHAVFQYNDQHGQADPEHAAVLRPIRAGDHRRAHPRQGHGIQEEGHLDGRGPSGRLPGGEPGVARCRGGSRIRPDAVSPLSEAPSRRALKNCPRCGGHYLAASDGGVGPT